MNRKEFIRRSAGTAAALTVSNLLRASEYLNPQQSDEPNYWFSYSSEETVNYITYDYFYRIKIKRSVMESDIEEVTLEVVRSQESSDTPTKSVYKAEVKKRSVLAIDNQTVVTLKCKCFDLHEGIDALKGSKLEKVGKKKCYIKLNQIANDSTSIILMDKKKKEIVTMKEQVSASGSDCYLTTICVDHFGKEDDCYELQTLRAFRDDFVSKQKNGKALISRYYEIGPEIVKAINASDHRSELLQDMYDQLVLPTLKLIDKNELHKASDYYVDYSLTVYDAL